MTNLPQQDDSAAGASGKASNQENSEQKLNQLLAGLWEQSRQKIADQVETLQRARRLAEQSELDDGTCAAAMDSAHKLAGVLGTFGLPRGTELARIAEATFRSPDAVNAAQLGALGPALNELEDLIRAAATYRGAGASTGQAGKPKV